MENIKYYPARRRNEMNTYLIPTTAEYTNVPYIYDHYILVQSQSHQDAYDQAVKNLFGYATPKKLDTYEFYPYELKLTYEHQHDPFPSEQKCDILNSIFLKTKGLKYMATFNVNWDKYTEALAEKADDEIWSNKTYPNNGILTNYITHTYKKLKEESNIIIRPNYGLFNTGLFTKYYDPIYAYSGNDRKIEFLTGYELSSRGIEERPQRANYFTKPELLVFDWHFPIDIQFDHILDDERNVQRLPEGFKEKENKVCILTGAIELMKKRVAANYKLAIPQYFDGKQQLLLPLCLDTDDNQPNLALAVTKLKSCYQGHTCLTLDMAYNNARLIAKPDSQWLRPTK